jgi:AraC family transcriptional regulator
MTHLIASATNGNPYASQAVDDGLLHGVERQQPVVPTPVARPVECQADGSKKYSRSSLLSSSAGLGWSTIAAELRSHGVGDSAAVVSQQAEVCLVVAGNEAALVRRTAAGQCHQAAACTGAIWLSPIGIGEVVTITAPIPQTLHLYLPWALFDRIGNDFNVPATLARSIQHVVGIRDEVISHLGSSILLELTNESCAGRAYVEAAAMALAARLLQKYCDCDAGTPADAPARGLDQARLRRVLDYIAANVQDDDITLNALANVAGYSPYHFARKFTLSVGVPPHRYIKRLRLEWAMAELAMGRLPLAEIALDAQFSSQASFTRAFRRVTGMTPKEYQRHRSQVRGVTATAA